MAGGRAGARARAPLHGPIGRRHAHDLDYALCTRFRLGILASERINVQRLGLQCQSNGMYNDQIDTLLGARTSLSDAGVAQRFVEAMHQQWLPPLYKLG